MRKRFYSVVIKIYRNTRKVLSELGKEVCASKTPKSFRRSEKDFEKIVKWFTSLNDAETYIVKMNKMCQGYDW